MHRVNYSRIYHITRIFLLPAKTELHNISTETEDLDIVNSIEWKLSVLVKKMLFVVSCKITCKPFEIPSS